MKRSTTITLLIVFFLLAVGAGFVLKNSSMFSWIGGSRERQVCEQTITQEDLQAAFNQGARESDAFFVSTILKAYNDGTVLKVFSSSTMELLAAFAPVATSTILNIQSPTTTTYEKPN